MSPASPTVCLFPPSPLTVRDGAVNSDFPLKNIHFLAPQPIKVTLAPAPARMARQFNVFDGLPAAIASRSTFQPETGYGVEGRMLVILKSRQHVDLRSMSSNKSL